MKIRANVGGAFELSRDQVRKRFEECAKLSALVATAKCSLDHTAELLDAGVRSKAGILKGLEAVHKMAVAAKNEFWTPEDRNPYAVEKGTKEMMAKVSKAAKDGKIDDKTAARISKSMKTLGPKVQEIWQKRDHWMCSIREHENVVKS
jgi:hypothetical protein